MTVVAEFIFWAALAGLAYIYAGYPLLSAALARLRPRPVAKGAFRGSVSVLISVHNEAGRLAAKLRSLLDAEDGERIVDILVGSDGSTDDVAAAVASVGDARIRLFPFAERRGKPAVLNELMPHVRGQVVVMTDARQPVAPGAIRALLANFADPRVGVVSGELVFRTAESDSTTARGVDAYWRYEKMIRKSESVWGSVPGATGALYAIRRELLAPIPPDTLLDDVAIPMRAVQQGFRCVFEAGAAVYDLPVQDPARESARKRRTIAGNGQLVQQNPSLLLPWRNPAWLAFLSHKLLRLLSPVLVLAVLAANIALLDRCPYPVLLAIQAAFYAAVAAGWISQRLGFPIGVLGVPFLFAALNCTTALALLDVVRRRYEVRWSRAPHR